jgi:hypothetical protein
MNMPRKPDDFDWVSARKECSLAEIFQKLRMLVEQDVDKRNGLLPEKSSFQFKLVSASEQLFSVVATGRYGHKSVVFRVNGDLISISTQEGFILEGGVVTLSNDGECRVKDKGVEYDLWQVRKMALEGIFFSDHSSL